MLDVLFKELELGKLMINFKRARVRCVCVRGGGLLVLMNLLFFFKRGYYEGAEKGVRGDESRYYDIM